MWFWWILFVSNLLFSLSMIICGWRMWKHSPKRADGVLGHKARKVIYSKEIWDKVHAECGKRWWVIGWTMLLPSALGQVLTYGKTMDVIGRIGVVFFVVECAALILTIMPNERRFRELRVQENLG